ncbi:Probable uridine nucleosidase 2 [Acanthosepion pharaonis]|uniref:Probable uridine nucleosidase 2 n=1 Tax=Acanthosepion pharaonis TaxID=158019 RepID=A0A812E5I1_ACAPH|nr:Probable uridine nucleosidase 2 [Sepia pharaonis]
MGSPGERKRLFLIDTDPGLDDAQAILMALAVDSINVIALTTVQGNSSSYASCLNALRLLKVADRLDIPVFPGCERALISPTLTAPLYHGEDGFGDVPDKEAPGLDMAQSEHAVLGLIRLIQENPGEITLVALGPLTNIAMAIRLEPTLGTKLKNCYIMGGNYRGIGNVTRSAEFNFANDAEAAHIVLTELKCPITLITWELCTDMKQPLTFWERLLTLPGRKAAFMHNIQNNVRRRKEDYGFYIMCDELAMAAAINEETILESHAVYAEVETQGKITKGQLVSDWRNSTGKQANVRLVTKMDINQVEELLINTYNE